MFSYRLGIFLAIASLLGGLLLQAQDAPRKAGLATQARQQGQTPQALMRRESNRQLVKLDKPVRLRLEPVDGDQLGRSGASRVRVMLEGAPKPINMFSFAVEYTTDTLTFSRQLRAAEGYLVTIAPPRHGENGMDVLWISGIALQGIQDGELMMMEFTVAPKGDRAALRLVDHPALNEKLSHDDVQTTFEYERVLDSAPVSNLKLVDRDKLPAAAQEQKMERRSVRRGS